MGDTLTIPPLDSATFAQMDEIASVTGVDFWDADTTMSQRIAAWVCYQRIQAGQSVSFEDVYRTEKFSDVQMMEPDPKDGTASKPV